MSNLELTWMGAARAQGGVWLPLTWILLHLFGHCLHPGLRNTINITSTRPSGGCSHDLGGGGVCSHPGVGRVLTAMEGSIVTILSRAVCVCVCVCVCVWQLPSWNSEVSSRKVVIGPVPPLVLAYFLRPSKAQKMVLSPCLYVWATFFTKTSALQTGRKNKLNKLVKKQCYWIKSVNLSGVLTKTHIRAEPSVSITVPLGSLHPHSTPEPCVCVRVRVCVRVCVRAGWGALQSYLPPYNPCP